MNQGRDLRDLVRQIAHSYAVDHLPEEARYFDLVWDGFVDSWSRGELERGGRLPPGLRFDDEVALPLVTPVVLVTVQAVLLELRDRGLSPTIPKLERAILVCASELGAPQDVSERLASALAPKIEAQSKQGSLASVSYANAVVPWVQRRESIKEEPTAGYLEGRELADVLEQRQNGQYRIFIDERYQTLEIHNSPVPQGSTTHSFWDDVSEPRLVTLLGLLLTCWSTGQGSLGYVSVGREINEAFDEDVDWLHIPRLWEDLHRRLGTRLGGAVRTVKAMKHFRVNPLTLCWIRANPEVSAFRRPT